MTIKPESQRLSELDKNFTGKELIKRKWGDSIGADCHM